MSMSLTTNKTTTLTKLQLESRIIAHLSVFLRSLQFIHLFQIARSSPVQGVDDNIDESGDAGSEGLSAGRGQLCRGPYLVALPPEGLYQQVVLGSHTQVSGGGVVHEGPGIDLTGIAALTPIYRTRDRQ